MKKPPLRHKANRNLRTGLSFLLCAILLLCFCSAPVLGAEPEETAPPEEDAPALETEVVLDAPALPAEAPDPDGEETIPQEPEEDPSPQTVTLTFSMGPFGTKTVTVEQGQYPTEIPDIPQLPAASVLGWYDEQGEPAEPAGYPAERDASYTARWERHVEAFLNTSDHTAYIQGYENGTFKPQKSMTRAEAAQMFYSLLRDKNWDKRSFRDVKEDTWYAESVGVMASLGVLNGYPDGTFRPGRSITRAEFVAVAVACDTLSGGRGSSFSDVGQASWAAPYISTATEKGWVSGFTGGVFRPNEQITRAQAVAILNRMLGRSPDPEIGEKDGVKDFYDVFPGSWSYGDILEASNSHTYGTTTEGELWYSYERTEAAPVKSGWIQDGSTRYYLDGATRKFLRGQHTIDGKSYLFDSQSGAAFTGFRKNGQWRRYYQNGLLLEDISGLGVARGPYFIKVYKNSNYLIVFAKDETGAYNTPVKAMRVSCGWSTPTGTYYTPDRYRWLQMIGDTWAQWCTQIYGNYLFHSVPNWTQSNMDLEVDEYNHLGETRSLGCIRLNCRDAKWIYENCSLGTRVEITTSESGGPLAKPGGLQIPAWHTWDPTDPTAQWRCQQNGCH